MIEIVRREFGVEAPLEIAWDHLSKVAEWPRWATHIQEASLTPPGEVAPSSIGTLKLRNGNESTFRVVEYELNRSWKWRGWFWWMTIDYDHQFTPVPGSRTKLTWIVEFEGFGASILGRIFAWQYNRNLDRAIPRLQKEIADLQVDL